MVKRCSLEACEMTQKWVNSRGETGPQMPYMRAELTSKSPLCPSCHWTFMHGSLSGQGLDGGSGQSSFAQPLRIPTV